MCCFWEGCRWTASSPRWKRWAAATAEAKKRGAGVLRQLDAGRGDGERAITVPLCACGVIIQDKNRGITADLLASPIPAPAARRLVLLRGGAGGLIVGGAVLVICFVWLACAGSWFLTAADVLGCIGTLVLSVLSSSTLLVFVVGFFRSQGAFTGLNVILGTVVGFLIGAYMPVSYFPTAVQYCTLFIPGTYSAGLLRNLMMPGALENIAQTVAAPFGAAVCRGAGGRIYLFVRLFRHSYHRAADDGGDSGGLHGAVRGAVPRHRRPPPQKGLIFGLAKAAPHPARETSFSSYFLPPYPRKAGHARRARANALFRL